MPTLETGNKPHANDAGVSLVEAMVALLIVSLVVGVVMLVAPGPERKTREAADQLAARMLFAGEESIVANRAISLVVTDEGYGFERLEDNGWFAVEQASPLGFRAWPDDIEVRVENAPDDPRVVRFDALGGATPASIVMSGAGARWRVTLDESGEVDVTLAE
jgi:general secretion pathway protein H